MGTAVVDRIEEWAQRPFDGGYRALQDLATRDFSGVVRVDGVELFFSRGTALAVRDGDLTAFESGSGAVYEAPSPVLPLLAVMQERSEGVRDSFYTEQTALSTVDETLSEGGFTGYVELSEDVLSGDYYVVYHAGRSMSVAFVGQSGRLVNGEEAFQAANDEVGIYRVRPVSVERLDLPAPDTDDRSEPATDRGRETAGGGASDPDTATDRDEPDERDPDESEIRTIPSVDPARSGRPGPDDTGSADTDPTASTGTVTDTGDGEPDGADRTEQPSPNTAAPERLKRQVQELERERDELQAELDRVQAERDELQAELNRVRDAAPSGSAGENREHDNPPEKDPTADANTTGEDGPGRDLTPAAALTETAVFVRYRSRSDVTLEDVHDGRGDTESLRANLRLELYGGFKTAVTVDGQPYETYIEGTTSYRVLEWILTELPFEIRGTGNGKALGRLYDALPRVDHADMQGTASTDGDAERFDIVFRDQRERPLLVVRIDETREPITATQMEQLSTAAERVVTADDSLQAAFLVTRSYFDVEALSVADEATKGRLLSRDRHKSFVSLSRKRGYHLCLVEAREGAFHVAVPEL